MKTIFIVLDTVRRDFLAAYGNDWVHTPSLTRLARSGVTFDNHWVGSLPCMPARREFMTGRYNFLDRPWGPIEPFDDVLPVQLRENGIFSHLLTDHYHYFELGGGGYHTSFSTWDFFRGQEQDPWVSMVDAIGVPEHLGVALQQNENNRLAQQREEEFSGPRTVQAAIDWLDVNRQADNWFLQVELFDPHEPFYCTEKYLKLYDDNWSGPRFDWPNYAQVAESPEAIRHVRNRYAALLTMTDHWVGKLLDKIEDVGIHDDTLIVFTTDHGTMLGEHDYWMKTRMPCYHEIARIPMIVRFPGGAHGGERCDALTQTIDIMPTVLTHHGIALPPHVQGRPIQGALAGGNQGRDIIFGYFGMATNYTDGRHVYFRNPVNDDAGPLHSYSAMPTTWISSYTDRADFERVEMGRYFGHTYNMPLFKISTPGAVPAALAGEESYTGRHQLYDLLSDPGQLVELDAPEVEERCRERIAAHLEECEAPREQYERLGIAPNHEA